MASPDTRTICNPTQLHVVLLKTGEKKQRKDKKTKTCWLCNVWSFKMQNYEIICQDNGCIFLKFRQSDSVGGRSGSCVIMYCIHR